MPIALFMRPASIALLLVCGSACSTTSGERGPGEPCTRGSDCLDDLLCSGGVCVAPDLDGGAEGGGGR